MKANLSNIQEIFSEIPNFYQATFNYNLLTENHFKDGWRDVVVPEITEYQKLSDEYILVNDVVTKKVIDFSDDEIKVIEKAKVPQSVTNSQFRLALINSGISITEINSFIKSIANVKQKETLEAFFEYSNYFYRDNEELIDMTKMLELNDAQLDGLFTLANTY